MTSFSVRLFGSHCPSLYFGNDGAAYGHAPVDFRSRLRSLDWLDGAEGDTKAVPVLLEVLRGPGAAPRPAVRGLALPPAAPHHPG
ncbi:MAG TPA: hypothetical protein VGM05_05085, partial [Planctomycetaceae bacterium]